MRSSLLIAAVVVAAVAAWLAADVLVRRAQATRLPERPSAGAMTPPVAAQIEEADRAARRHPASAEAVGDLARTYQASGQIDLADQAYAVAESLSSDWRWTYARGLLQEEHGQQAMALAAYTRVTSANASHGLAWFHLAEIAFKDGRLEAAEAAYTRALDLPAATPFSVAGVTHRGVPLATYAALGLARIAIERGQSAQARARLESIVRTQPRFGPARSVLRPLQSGVSTTEGALVSSRGVRAYVPPADAWLDAIVAESRQSDLLLKHAALAAREGDQAWREFLVKRALEFNPAALDVLLEMAAALQAAGRHDQALEFLKRGEQVAPDDHHVLVEQGKTLADLGRLDEAERVLRRAARVRDAAAEYNLGTVMDHLGRADEARTHYEQALAIDPFHVRAMNNLAVMHDMGGDSAAAIGLLSRALQIDPEDPEVLSNLGTAFINQRRYADARRVLESAVALDPRAADAHNNLGIALAQTGQLAEARQQFTEALRLDPKHESARANLAALDRHGQ
jgi:Flp pilus assembly protein TadD